ncbi:hypothetical protein ABW20_dc0100416 [Dactylellina cionopaga]|nr:hypothetical protein ABW20_dc0100416 [Dactylellina cionopaga]
MPRRTTIPQSQAPYKPVHRTTASAEPHELRENSPVNYQSSTEEEPSQKDASSDIGQWWEVRRITAERGKGRNRRYRVEWEGTDSNGQPWPQEWKFAEEITTAVIDSWLERKKKKRKREPSSSPSPVREIGVAKPVEVAGEELHRFQRARKIRKTTTRANPIIISSSPVEAAIEGVEESEESEVEEQTGEKQAEDNSADDTTGNSFQETRPRAQRRRIIDSSLESNERLEEEGEKDEADDIPESRARTRGLVTVEIPLLDDLQRSQYIVCPTPDPSPDLGGNEAVSEADGEADEESINEPNYGPHSIPSLEEIEEFGQIEIFGISEDESPLEVEVQVPNTQSSRRGRREIPDSQSSGATPVILTPVDQRPVPETPLNIGPVVVQSPLDHEHLQVIPEILTSDVAANHPFSQHDLDNDFADIPDSSNRTFSQDVRELKNDEAQSQNSSKGSQNTNRSQQSQMSIPSAQLSFGKIGVTPSFQSFSEQEPKSSSSMNSRQLHAKVLNSDLGAVVAVESSGRTGKSVVGEAAPALSPRSDQQQPLEVETPRSPQPNHPRLDRESATDTETSFVTAKPTSERLLDDSPASNILEDLSESLPSQRRLERESVRILQQAVESRPTYIVEAHPESPAQPAQLEALQSQDQEGQRQDEALAGIDSSSLRNLQPYEPLSFGTNFETFPPLLSPRTPIREDSLQGDRLAVSTTYSPIPASVKPAPVTVLGYFPSKRDNQKASQDGQALHSRNNTVESNTPLQQALSDRSREQPPPSPSRETRASRRKRLEEEEDNMSAAPVPQLLHVADIPSPVDHQSSPRRQGAVTRSSNLLSSPSQPLNTQASNVVDRMEITPVPEDLPSIDDEVLAASQSLNVLQAPTQSSPSEIFLAIPLNDKQQSLYKETLLASYQDFETFVGINNTQNQDGTSVSVETMENLIHKLDAIATHLDLPDNFKHSQAGPKVIEWFCKQSTKFTLVSTLLQKLENETYTVAIVAEEGILMEYLEIFVRSAGYKYIRYGGATDSRDLETKQTEGLHISLVPSRASGTTDLPSANVIIGMDSTLDSSAPHIAQLQNGVSTPAPIIHLVGINTVAHILLCLPNSIQANRQEHINPVLFAAYLIREDVGVLSQNLLDKLDALSVENAISWIESLQNSLEALLPPLRYDPQNTQGSGYATQGAVLPARLKRVLSLSAAPTISSGKHKKARIDPSQASPPRRADTPMADSEDTAMISEVVVEVPESEPAEEPSSIGKFVNAGDITHVTSTIPDNTKPEGPIPAAEEAQEEGGETQEESMNDAEPVAEVGEVNQEIQENFEDEEEEEEEEESEEEILNAMEKEDLIALVREYQEDLLRRTRHTDEWERHIEDREVDYQEQREKIGRILGENREQLKEIASLTKQRDRSKAFADLAVEERNQARDDLKQFKDTLLDNPEAESARTKIMFDNMELNTKVIIFERKRKSLEQEVDFVRQQYQMASHAGGVLAREKAELEVQLSEYKRKADDVKVQLKALNLDKERARYQHTIKELRAKLDRSNKQIITLEAEKKRVERTRGLQTRGSSIPPRGAQSSPAPTRPASPTPPSHRHMLRNIDNAQ